MSKYRIPFAKPYFSDEDVREINAKVKEILQSGWLTSGPVVQQFETEFAQLVGTAKAVCLNSCTAALHSVLLGLGIKNGAEVLVPSNTFVATANAVLYVGARPIFADSNPETFNISTDEVRARISKKTKAIIVVHMGGNPCEMKQLATIAAEHKIPIIEDCAHAHGAKYRGENCGAIGEAGCFSFYPTKIITTAEGGLITTNNAALASKISIIRNHGRAGYGPAEITNMGFNFRLTEIHAAIGLVQLKHLSEFLTERNKLAKTYGRELEKIGWLKPQHVENGNFCSYYTYIVKLTDEAPANRDDLMKKLKEKGIETSVLYHPVHLQPLYVKLFGCERGQLPVAEELGEKSLALPLYNGMKVEDVLKVTESIRDISDEA